MVQDVTRQGISPATGSEVGSQAVVDFNFKADGALNIPHGETNTLNGAKDIDGYIRATNGDLYLYTGGVWKKVGGSAEDLKFINGLIRSGDIVQLDNENLPKLTGTEVFEVTDPKEYAQVAYVNTKVSKQQNVIYLSDFTDTYTGIDPVTGHNEGSAIVQAYNSISDLTGSYIFILSNKRYKPTGFTGTHWWNKPNISLKGKGIGGFASDGKSIVGGTVITGEFACSASGLSFSDLAFDIGFDYCAEYSLSSSEGFVPSFNPGQLETIYNSDVNINNVRVLQKANAPGHNTLLEFVDGFSINNLITLYGNHGIIIKSVNGSLTNSRAYGHDGECVILKGDSYAKCENVIVNGVIMNRTPYGVTDYDTISYRNGLMLNPQASIMKNIQLDNIQSIGYDTGLYMNGGFEIDVLQIGNASVKQANIAVYDLTHGLSHSISNLNVGDANYAITLNDSLAVLNVTNSVVKNVVYAYSAESGVLNIGNQFSENTDIVYLVGGTESTINIGKETIKDTTYIDVVGGFTANRNQNISTLSKSANYTLSQPDFYNVDEVLILVNATSGNIVITLPPCLQSKNKKVTVKKIDDTANLVTLAAYAFDGGTIDGSATKVLSGQYESVTVISNGSTNSISNEYDVSIATTLDLALANGNTSNRQVFLGGTGNSKMVIREDSTYTSLITMQNRNATQQYAWLIDIGSVDDGIFALFDLTASLPRLKLYPTGLTEFPGKIQVGTAPTNPTDVVRLTDLSNYVTLGTTQTITGVKNFENDANFKSDFTKYAPSSNLRAVTLSALSYASGDVVGSFNLYSNSSLGVEKASVSIKVPDNLSSVVSLIAPSVGGTLARIEDLANYVDKTTAQTISGVKTFNSSVLARNGAEFNVVVSSGAETSVRGGEVNIYANSALSTGFTIRPSDKRITFIDGSQTTYLTFTTPTSPRNIVVPNKSGTVALVEDFAEVNLKPNADFNFAGTGNYSWTGVNGIGTLPALSVGLRRYFIKNRGTGTLVINSNTGSNDVYSTVAVNTVSLLPGEALILNSDGDYYNVN